MKPEQKLRLVCNDQITGFSYSFSKALLEFLEKRCREESLYISEKKEKRAREDLHNGIYPLLPVVQTAIIYLSSQMNSSAPSSFAEISNLLDQTKAFLAIFEKSKPISKLQEIADRTGME
ncbi:MAG: hypothetical protein HY507_00155 [Candidatus Zambryskibacteria bacterium]|nr:hypothetical protein [Candidatus Zambryskibacteria bacterium]